METASQSGAQEPECDCEYCQNASQREFVYPDGVSEPVSKWCSGPE